MSPYLTTNNDRIVRVEMMTKSTPALFVLLLFILFVRFVVRFRFQPCPQRFGHAPRLGDAAARRVRRFGVEDFADRPHTRLAEMIAEAGNNSRAPAWSLGMHLQPGVHKRTGQPCPIPSPDDKRRRAPGDRRRISACNPDCRGPANAGPPASPAFAHHLQHRLPAFAVKHRMIEGNREYLIGPARRIVALLTVHYVKEIAGLRVPESTVKRCSALSRRGRPRLSPPTRRPLHAANSPAAAARCTKGR